MTSRYAKGKSFQLSKHFKSLEFDCHCKYPECKFTIVNDELVTALETLRKKAKPIHITSGYRCSRHNQDINGKIGSYHLLGRAADIYVEGLDISTLYYYAVDIPSFKRGGVGVAFNFIHVDTRGYCARWNYPIA